jgi:hypothetical protein
MAGPSSTARARVSFLHVARMPSVTREVTPRESASTARFARKAVGAAPPCLIAPISALIRLELREPKQFMSAQNLEQPAKSASPHGPTPMPKGQEKHLDTRELIAHNLVIKYHHDRPPTKDVRKRLCAAASMASRVMRSTVWAIDKVALFHVSEPDTLTKILDKHFCLNNAADLASAKTGKKLDNSKKRRAYISKVRSVMLSVSFHLSTGMYLLDVDAGHRTTVGDFHIDDMDAGWKEATPAGKHAVSKNIEGYVQQRPKGIMEKSTGPVHLSFGLAAAPHDYSAARLARVIIHEATHSFCRTIDVKYCWDDTYDAQDPHQMVNNADSFAYAAMSIRAGKVLDYNGLANAADNEF